MSTTITFKKLTKVELRQGLVDALSLLQSERGYVLPDELITGFEDLNLSGMGDTAMSKRAGRILTEAISACRRKKPKRRKR